MDVGLTSGSECGGASGGAGTDATAVDILLPPAASSGPQSGCRDEGRTGDEQLYGPWSWGETVRVENGERHGVAQCSTMRLRTGVSLVQCVNVSSGGAEGGGVFRRRGW